MEPVDRIQARAAALRDLGVAQTASSDEIREAWRRVAFRAHPDHAGGDHVDFARAKAAFDLLREDGLTKNGRSDPEGPPKPRRPKLRSRIVDLSPQEIEACRGQLAADMDDATPDKPAEHIPDAVGCHGRHLTYFVSTSVCEGGNRVALPTSILDASRRLTTEVLSFQSKSAGAGEIIVPDGIRERKFPGAKSVKVRFQTNPENRREFMT